jgi:DNA mismatch repair protein MutS
MVEMNEVANILHNATRDSLLILDEIGRGTSTFDGLSIAWAVLEALADESSCGAKSLFATHYHELTELEGKIPGVKNYHVTVKEIGEDIVFLRRIVRGSGDRSFGIQVAKLAGIPDSVLSRAKVILKDLEESDIAHPAASPKERSGGSQVPKQINLFEINQEARAIKILKEMDVDNLTPKEAISELYSLHHMVADQEN